MTTVPVYCSGCRIVGIGVVELATADPAAIDLATSGAGLCATCAAAYRAQLVAGNIEPGQVPPGLDKRPRQKRPAKG